MTGSWQEHEELSLQARKTAAKRPDKITKELKWQSGAAARQSIQKQYPTKQKQMNKQFSNRQKAADMHTKQGDRENAE